MSAINDFVNWISKEPVEYDNFLALTAQPQVSPFGSKGNPQALSIFEKEGHYRNSSPENPFMNPLPTDYGSTRTGKGANPRQIGAEAHKNFYKNLFRTPEDILWSNSFAEHQFNTLPSTSIPNDAILFATWLNGNNFVGKTASIYSKYGYPYTMDSLEMEVGQPANVPETANYVDHNYNLPLGYSAAPFSDNPNYGWGFGGLGEGAIPLNTGYDDYEVLPMPKSVRGTTDLGTMT